MKTRGTTGRPALTVTLVGGPWDGQTLDVGIVEIDMAERVDEWTMGLGTYRCTSDHIAQWVGWWHTFPIVEER